MVNGICDPIFLAVLTKLNMALETHRKVSVLTKQLYSNNRQWKGEEFLFPSSKKYFTTSVETKERPLFARGGERVATISPCGYILGSIALA